MDNNSYTRMQKLQYESEASMWSVEPGKRNYVIGDVDHHNNHEDYNKLFDNIPEHSTKIVLDFGCGPGRNLVKYTNKFMKIDGVDISQNNINNAKKWITYNNYDINNYSLYVCNGVDLSNIPSELYDIIMSTICLQHICVYDIRYNYFKEFFRVLKPGGYLAIQMGFGKGSPSTVDYYSNYYDAPATNRACDTEVADPSQIENDLKAIGYINFTFTLGKPCDDSHHMWIFFNAQKPL